MLFLKYKIESDMGKILESRLSKNEDYIWNTPPDYQATVEHIFKEQSLVVLDIVIIGYLPPPHPTNTKIWIGRCRRYRSSNKIIIENAHLLDKKHKESLETLCKEVVDGHAKFLFVADISNKKFNSIISDFNANSIKNKAAIEIENRKRIGSYTSLSENDISDFVVELEKNLHNFAQRSLYAKRPYGLKKPDPFRSEFQRDKERIMHAKAFRRLVDKAQIYTSTKGDHFRTRMTHTLEVAQIAKGVARALRLNEDLAEAIALGHDLGHTPFGHEGERELHLIMSGKKQLSESHSPRYLGGFKHNYQGLRIANYLEEKYGEIEGLDLTYQILEGVLKHTKVKKCKKEERKCDTCTNQCFDINEFFAEDTNFLHLDFDFPTTLEGQIVFLADEIAQREHDLDDGIASGVLDIDKLLGDFKEYNLFPLIEIVENAQKNIIENEENRHFVDKSDLARAIIVSDILGFFLNNLIDQSKENMQAYEENLLKKNFSQEKLDELVITEKVIAFEDNVKYTLDTLDLIISQKVINSQEINCFDGKSAYIVRKLFKAYYSNPRQLPDSTLNRLDREIQKITKNHTNIRTGNRQNVEREIAIYKGDETDDNAKESANKHNIFMRCIADLISGMTDNYANRQFKKLYLPE